LVRELSEAYERGEYEGQHDAASEVCRGFQATCDAFGLVVKPKKKDLEEIPADIENLAQKRWNAKLSKNWAMADQLRNELLELGWVVKDGKEKFELTRACE
jgi:cysteinyl-tRNA synthetase